MRRLLVSKEDVLPEYQEWNLSLDQKGSEPPNIKEEQEELWVSQEGKQLHGLGEADITTFSVTVVSVKSEDEEKPQSSQLHQSQRDESTEEELLVSNSTEPRTLKTEADGEDCGGPQPARDSGPYLQPETDDVQQLQIKDEILPEQQEWNLNVDQEDIKDEQEKLWISQQEQQLHQLEEADITKFPFTSVPVKTENDEEKPQSSSHLHQSQSDDSREAEPVASSSTAHRTLTAQADGEDYGGPQPASNSGQNSCSQHGRSSDSFQECGHMNYLNLQNGRQASDKPFSCSECDKKFGMKGNLITHMRIHTGEKPFVCSECGKRFGLKCNLTRHTRIHTGEKPFGCSECGKRFGQKGDLVTHMRIHTGEKPFTCSECGERFGLKCNLFAHMRIHTGQKPFVCSECSKRFGLKCSLIAHMRIHTGEKPFCCSECGERFGEKSSLIRHMRIHTGQKPFGCSDCGERFGQKGTLVRHMRIHTGEKPFDCSECGAKFKRKGNLATHMRIHTGQKPFVCSECGKRFGLKCNLIRHIRIHAREKPFGC